MKKYNLLSIVQIFKILEIFIYIDWSSANHNIHFYILLSTIKIIPIFTHIFNWKIALLIYLIKQEKKRVWTTQFTLEILLKQFWSVWMNLSCRTFLLSFSLDSEAQWKTCFRGDQLPWDDEIIILGHYWPKELFTSQLFRDTANVYST